MDFIEAEHLTHAQIASLCDHTFLKRAEGFREQAKKGESPVRLREEELHRFLWQTIESPLVPYAICVRAEDVVEARRILDEGGKERVKIAAVVGFPSGVYPTALKAAEADYAMEAGADEIDMVLLYEALKAKETEVVSDDIAAVVQVVSRFGGKTKLILEISELTHEEIATACQLAMATGVDFVKTSTGFGAWGARPEEVALMRRHFDRGVKISGGVKASNVKALLRAASGREDGKLLCDPSRVRLGESGLLQELSEEQS